MNTDTRNFPAGSFGTLMTAGTVALVQLLDDGPVVVSVNTSQPAATKRGVVLSRKGPEPMAVNLTGLGPSDIVYVRSVTEGETSTVAIITDGTIAPQAPE